MNTEDEIDTEDETSESESESESNSVISMDKGELEKISRMAALRAKIVDMSDAELTKFMAEVSVGKFKEFHYKLVTFGNTSNTSERVLLLLLEDEPDLGFSERLTDGFEVKHKFWRKALTDAMKGME